MENAVRENKDGYRVNFDLFEGPLDLLLYLIKKNDLDIFDIPVAFITEEYLKYLDAMKELNIDIAGEFLLMAAELMHIKSKMLLPSESTSVEEEEPDPREDLVKRLLEYQRYKAAAESLAQMNQLGREVYKQLNPESIRGQEEVMGEGNIYELIEAFHNVLKRLPKDRVREITIDRISVNERIFQLIDVVKAKKTFSLSSLFSGAPQRHEIVVTFLALLEMARLKIIRVHQSSRGGEIYITGVLEEITEDAHFNQIKMAEEMKDGYT